MHDTAIWTNRLSIVEDPRRLTVHIPVRRRRFPLILLGSWLVVWLLGEIALGIAWAEPGLKGASEHPPPRGLLGVLFAAFTLAGAWVAWRFLWRWAGKESLTLTPEALIVRRSIGRLGRSRRFPLSEVHRFRVGRLDDTPVYPSWGRMFVGEGRGYLAFDHGGRTHRVGRGLSESEARYVHDLVRERYDTL